jgi:hypothetical protein
LMMEEDRRMAAQVAFAKQKLRDESSNSS